MTAKKGSPAGKRASKTKSKKQYTLSEFKAWLEGIEELQPDDWSPDASQWKTIREKLLNITEEVVEVQAPVQAPVQQTIPSGPVYREPTQYNQAPPQFVQPSQTSLPVHEMTEAARMVLNGKLPSTMVPDASGKLKTPNIDTMDGNYGSSFE